MAHAGSWSIGGFQLPDFGITEKIGDLFGQGRNEQGGSQLRQGTVFNVGNVPIYQGYTPAQQQTFSTGIGTKAYVQPTNTGGNTGGSGGGGNPSPSGDTGGGQPQEDPMARIKAEVESIFSPLMNYYNQAESAVTEEYNRYKPELEQQYATSLSDITNQKTQGERELAQQEEAAGRRREDALSAARRLYDELRRGGRQRFGGASSAGQAFTELTAQEQQRQSGNVWQAYQTAVDNLNKYKANLLDNFAQAQKELELAKTSALNQAYSDYQNRLNQIRSMRAQTESSKASLALEALQNLRNQAYQINLQSLNLAQTLAANKQMAVSYVDNYAQKVMNSLMGGQTTYQNLVAGTTTNPTTNLSIGGRQATTTPGMIGSIRYTRPEEYLQQLGYYG
uniref:Uncharacterized protein n=1 Tax=candidate division CPR3 bacterium TaxID=2268181 RepID=A0A7C5UVL9_UNCC3